MRSEILKIKAETLKLMEKLADADDVLDFMDSTMLENIETMGYEPVSNDKNIIINSMKMNL